MLYGCFRTVMVFMSIMALIVMIATDSYTFVMLPISMLIWGLFTFFDENDKEHCRRNGIKRSMDVDAGWLFGKDGYSLYPDSYMGSYQYSNNYHHQQYKPPKTVHYQDPEYKKIAPRCKRSVTVTINNIKKE